MSRETDSPSPSPRGWDPQRSEGNDGTPPGAAQPAEKKTETTMTTRIRINIPGSRPIPPVVMRETLDDDAAGDETPAATADRAPAAPGLPGLPVRPKATGATSSGLGESAAPAKKKTSSWFEPRKPPQAEETGALSLGDTTFDAPPAPRKPQPDETGPNPAWFPDTPPEGTGLPPRPVSTSAPSGPTTGPATGDLALPAAVTDEPGGPTLDLGGPFPPPPPPGHGDTAAIPVFGEPAGGPAVPPPALDFDEDPEEPAPAPAPAAPAAPKKAKGKAGKLGKLVVVAVVLLGVAAYGTGLLLNQEDVPKGTTVLGQDIGGRTTQEAVALLDAAVDEANNAPLLLQVGDAELELKPSVAGLAVDTEATVRAAAGPDYAPASVFGSLLGSERPMDAVFAVDREKLTVALEDLTAGLGAGAPVEGSITFSSAGPQAQPGKAGEGINVEAAADAVESAFRTRAAGGENTPVTLPTTTVEPEITEEEVARAMAEFAEPAMSDMVYIEAGGITLPMSPENSIYQFLSMKAVDGTLVDVYDLEILASLYGSQFDSVLVTRGNGTQTPVEPTDVAGALREALRETDPAKRVAVIDLDPS